MPNVMEDTPFPFHVRSSGRLVNGMCLRRWLVAEQGPEPTSPQGACGMSKNDSSVVVALSHRDVGPVCYCSTTSLALPETGHLSGHRETSWVDVSTVGPARVERVEMAGSAQIVCKMWTSDWPMHRVGWVREKGGGSAGYPTLPSPPASPLPYFSSLCPRRRPARQHTDIFLPYLVGGLAPDIAACALLRGRPENWRSGAPTGCLPSPTVGPAMEQSPGMAPSFTAHGSVPHSRPPRL